MQAITLLETLRGTIHCVTEPTGFVILTDAIQYLKRPCTYVRRGFNDREIVSLTCGLCGEPYHDHRTSPGNGPAFCMAPASRTGDQFVKGGR